MCVSLFEDLEVIYRLLFMSSISIASYIHVYNMLIGIKNNETIFGIISVETGQRNEDLG